jgi:hypothetical protein
MAISVGAAILVYLAIWLSAALIFRIGVALADQPATATAQAVRLDTHVPRLEIDMPPIVIVGPTGLPFAPAGLDDCAEMTWYRVQAGLPDRFDQLGYRESRCTNTPVSRTGCCVGYWQLHEIIFRDHRLIEPLARCKATWLNVRGDDPASKQRNACAAKQLFDTAGYQPWSLG